MYKGGMSSHWLHSLVYLIAITRCFSNTIATTAREGDSPASAETSRPRRHGLIVGHRVVKTFILEILLDLQFSI
ncbi:unnamed protein product [Darwinula stevensoni]|uniref:Secreted protein n=1 Tax=Darwinula stevensoni TaxID=69355 RepID=A0A7R8XAN8_9CRUS|nr:unnamed protein product [Darwinula stevensoni]CAG0886921.1 unnamed protein product [Darwinula stevensoni]